MDKSPFDGPLEGLKELGNEGGDGWDAPVDAGDFNFGAFDAFEAERQLARKGWVKQSPDPPVCLLLCAV